MEYYEGRLCVSYQELVDGGIMSAANYKQIAARGKCDASRWWCKRLLCSCRC